MNTCYVFLAPALTIRTREARFEYFKTHLERSAALWAQSAARAAADEAFASKLTTSVEPSSFLSVYCSTPHGSFAVEALRCKPEAHGFETR
jgi:hypothetical protein